MVLLALALCWDFKISLKEHLFALQNYRSLECIKDHCNTTVIYSYVLYLYFYCNELLYYCRQLLLQLLLIIAITIYIIITINNLCYQVIIIC